MAFLASLARPSMVSPRISHSDTGHEGKHVATTYRPLGSPTRNTYAATDPTTPGGKQVQQLHAAAARLNFHHIFTRLPPPPTYIFKHISEPDCRSRRLLIGRTTNTCTWAVLRVIQSGYNKSTAIVGYSTEHLPDKRPSDNGYGLPKMPVGVDGQPVILEAANLAPFNVFAGYGDPYHRGQAFRLLGLFVRYLFLVTRERDKVVPDEILEDGLSAVVTVYWSSALKALDQECELFWKGPTAWVLTIK
jgi:hypothetical protein